MLQPEGPLDHSLTFCRLTRRVSVVSEESCAAGAIFLSHVHFRFNKVPLRVVFIPIISNKDSPECEKMSKNVDI